MNHKAHEGHEGITKGAESVASAVVDSAIKVHRALGAGLLESAYEQCLAHELEKRGLSVRTQVPMPLIYEGLEIGAGYRIDLLVRKRLSSRSRRSMRFCASMKPR
jgi:GxxExxY protein